MTDSKAKGILRSSPRYSTNNGANNSNTNSTTSSSENGPSNSSSNVPVRPSLADLMRSSAELSAEAARITDEDVGRVVSHQHHGVPSNNAPEITAVSNNIQEQQEKIITEGMPLLQISESGAPYLKVGGVTDACANNGPAVVDANGDIAFGIVGENGEHVRFCEHSIDDAGKENDETISSRERIQNRLYMNDAGDEDMFDQEEPENNCNISDSESDATDDDAILAELGMSDLIPSDHDSDNEPEEDTFPKQSNDEMRAFLIIWQTLSRWVTPATIDLLQHGQCVDDKSTVEPQSTATEELSNDGASERRSVEIGASRRSGITSMIRMYIARSMAELKRMPQQTQQQKDTLNDQRKIEQRLADLVRTFDINGPVAKFNAKQWKVMTIILIVISFPSLVTDDSIMPASAQSLGMTTDEYRYLTRSAVTSLSNAL